LTFINKQTIVTPENAREYNGGKTVIEDAIPHSQYKNWLERSILALESFTMKDAPYWKGGSGKL